jgi:hypothetical protein
VLIFILFRGIVVKNNSNYIKLLNLIALFSIDLINSTETYGNTLYRNYTNSLKLFTNALYSSRAVGRIELLGQVRKRLIAMAAQLLTTVVTARLLLERVASNSVYRQIAILVAAVSAASIDALLDEFPEERPLLKLVLYN